jgi:hypothetical protein
MDENEIIPAADANDFIFYTTTIDDGRVKISVVVRGETIWLTQQQIADLFGRDRSVISKHLKNIFESDELQENSACVNFAHTAADGKNYQTNYYNLDAIISVRLSHSSRQEQGQRPGNQTKSRSGIRQIPPHSRPNLPVRF